MPPESGPGVDVIALQIDRTHRCAQGNVEIENQRQQESAKPAKPTALRTTQGWLCPKQIEHQTGQKQHSRAVMSEGKPSQPTKQSHLTVGRLLAQGNGRVEDGYYKKIVQSVDFGDGCLAPPDRAEPKSQSRGQPAPPLTAAQPLCQQIEQADRSATSQGAEQIHAPGPVAKREDHPAPQTAEECVEGVARGVGDGKSGGDQLKFQAVVEKRCNPRRSGQPVEDAGSHAHQPAVHCFPAASLHPDFLPNFLQPVRRQPAHFTTHLG